MVIRLLLAILIGTTLIGAPAVQAAITMPCDVVASGITVHQPSADRTPASVPCKAKMPGCADMLGCGLSASLLVRVVEGTNEQVWRPAAYWPVADCLEGLFVKPDLSPPIAI